MRGRIEIMPEKMNTFSAILIKFPDYEKVMIFPKSKILILEDGVELNDSVVRIIRCRVGERLFLEINGREKYRSDFDIFQIKVKR